MNQEMHAHWQGARQHEARGDIAGAKAAYQAMLLIEPMQVVPQLRLSRFAQMEGNYVASHAHVLHASRIASVTRNTKDVGFVTLRLLAFAEDAEVARLIHSLDWSDPELLRQSPVLAQHLWLVGRFDDALELLTTASAKARPNALLSYTRANVLRSLGRLEEATEHYEYALKLSPHDPYAHWSLAYHQPSRPAGARVKRIRAALTQHAAGSIESAHLHYALFKEHDDAGDTEAAWKALSTGAAIVHSGLAHDPTAEASRFAYLQRTGDGERRDARQAVPGQPTPVFIVGMPRTGTTLLDRILGNHPDVVSLGERNDFNAAISEASGHFFGGGLVESDWTRLRGLDVAAAGQVYLRKLAPFIGDSRFFIDKNPQNFHNIGLILRALPQAKVLCLEREAMDACFSNLKELFEGGAYPYSYSFEGLAAHRKGFQRMLRHWQTVAPGAVHVVGYEDLVEQGDGTLARVLDFCGLSPVPGLLDITSNRAPVSTASSSQVRQPIHSRSIGAWRRYEAQLEPLRLLLEKGA